jgi:hypothetical protein
MEDGVDQFRTRITMVKGQTITASSMAWSNSNFLFKMLYKIMAVVILCFYFTPTQEELYLGLLSPLLLYV